MKRGIFIAAVSLLFGVSANAQIKVTSSEIQIGDGLTVGSSQMDVKKPVYIWPYTLQQTGVQEWWNIINIGPISRCLKVHGCGCSVMV